MAVSRLGVAPDDGQMTMMSVGTVEGCPTTQPTTASQLGPV
jgi:hypothetical protein